MFTNIYSKINSFMPKGGKLIDHIYIMVDGKERVKVIYEFKGELRTFNISSRITNSGY